MSDYQPHDPDAGPLDYSIDFTNWLNSGDSISSVAWSINPTGPTLASESESSGVATIQVDGGVLGNVYRLTARATTAAGLVDDRSIVLRCGNL